MDAVINILAGLLILAGSTFTFVAAIGILRLPDVYSRSHAASKAGTLGSGLLLLAIAIVAMDASVATRAVAAFIFFILTAPVSAHLLMRAAYYVGHKPWEGTHIDHLAGRYSSDPQDNVHVSGTSESS